MHGSSEFVSPGRHEYANVQALNAAWLLATTDMKGPQRGRMAAVSFLLFSVQEQDLDWWEQALSDVRQEDLLTAMPAISPELGAVQAAALGFLWQLLQTNPYAARVISGASVEWCELLAGLPLVELLEKVAWRSDLTTARIRVAGQDGALLRRITSSQQAVRNASQRVALQRMLTTAGSGDYAALPAAACAMPGPLAVADPYLGSCKKV